MTESMENMFLELVGIRALVSCCNEEGYSTVFKQSTACT